jgi:hypothetical protein
LQGPYRPRALAENYRHFCHGEPADHPQENNIGLIGRQPRYGRKGFIGQESDHGFLLDITAVPVGEKIFVRRRKRMFAFCSATSVDQSSPGYGENPRGKVSFVPLKSRESGGNVKPSLGGQVLGISMSKAQVSEKARLCSPIEFGQCIGLASLGG